MFQFVASGTKLGCGEHGYGAFLFVNLSYGVGPCCFLFFHTVFHRLMRKESS